MLSRNAAICTFIAVFSLIGIDQYTKYWGAETLLVHADTSDTRLYRGSRQPIMEFGDTENSESGSFFLLQCNYVRNHGAAWGVLSSLTEKQRSTIFQRGTIALCCFLAYLAFQKRWPIPRLTRISILIIVGGASSNLIDRLIHGYVVDVLDMRLQWGAWRYALPAFNGADAMIVFGLLMATVAEFRGMDRKQK